MSARLREMEQPLEVGCNTLLRISLSLLITCTIVACGAGSNKGTAGNNSEESASSEGNPASPTQNVGALYVFGDSLSDTGNLGRPLTLGDDLPAPFYQNRISNGPVIVDYVASSLGQTLAASNYLSSQENGTNYAIAGANAYADGVDIDLAVQVQSYLLKNRAQVDSNDNFVIFIGGNDILDSVALGESAAIAIMDLALAQVRKAVSDLALFGANKFFVLTAPDIGKTPKLRLEDPVGNGRRALATTLAQYYNAGLRSELSTVTTSGVRINIIDVYAIFNDIIDRAGALGFTNAIEPCYITDEFRFSSTCSAAQLDSYIFFDDVHPSGRTHQLVGEEVARQVDAVLNSLSSIPSAATR